MNDKKTIEELLPKSGRTLSKIDSFIQSETKFEKIWERGTTTNNYCGNEGWENVEKNYPRNFEIAWTAAILFILEYNIDPQEIANYY